MFVVSLLAPLIEHQVICVYLIIELMIYFVVVVFLQKEQTKYSVISLIHIQDV